MVPAYKQIRLIQHWSRQPGLFAPLSPPDDDQYMMIIMKDDDADDVTLMISSACLAWASLTPSKPFLAFRWLQHTVTLFFVALEIMIKIIIINIIVMSSWEECCHLCSSWHTRRVPEDGVPPKSGYDLVHFIMRIISSSIIWKDEKQTRRVAEDGVPPRCGPQHGHVMMRWYISSSIIWKDENLLTLSVSVEHPVVAF